MTLTTIPSSYPSRGAMWSTWDPWTDIVSLGRNVGNLVRDLGHLICDVGHLGPVRNVGILVRGVGHLGDLLGMNSDQTWDFFYETWVTWYVMCDTLDLWDVTLDQTWNTVAR